MAEDAEDRDPQDDFQEMLRRLFASGESGFDAAEFERLTGRAPDPAMLEGVMQQLQGAFAAAQRGDADQTWELAKRQALHLANQSGLSVTAGQRTEFDEALALAGLWLGEATTISELPTPPRAITRGAWVEQTLPVWQELAEPVAVSFARAVTDAMREQAPEDVQPLIQSVGSVMSTISGSLYATQFGQVIGRLSTEVISGGDVGIPLLPAGEAVILPQNFADFGRDLEIGEDQLALYVSVRELAHARLFRHARWLRLHVIAQITEYARGNAIDTEKVEEIAARFDPSHPEEMRALLESGGVLREPTEAQRRAQTRLENLLATVEGWVEVVTEDATARLPRAAAIAETVRRRRAAGGPAEEALGHLVGLQLRPRRLREAAVMWRTVTDELGIAARDALWDYPDFMPTAEDIDRPDALVARIRARAAGEAPPADELDDAIARILAGDEPDDERPV